MWWRSLLVTQKPKGLEAGWDHPRGWQFLSSSGSSQSPNTVRSYCRLITFNDKTSDQVDASYRPLQHLTLLRSTRTRFSTSTFRNCDTVLYEYLELHFHPLPYFHTHPSRALRPQKIFVSVSVHPYPPRSFQSKLLGYTRRPHSSGPQTLHHNPTEEEDHLILRTPVRKADCATRLILSPTSSLHIDSRTPEDRKNKIELADIQQSHHVVITTETSKGRYMLRVGPLAQHAPAVCPSTTTFLAPCPLQPRPDSHLKLRGLLTRRAVTQNSPPPLHLHHPQSTQRLSDKPCLLFFPQPRELLI